jgi:hypothetical protein
MTAPPLPRNRRLTIIAQDPSVTRGDGRILTTQVEIPAEELAVGPWGYRVQVVDFDVVRGVLYPPPEYGGPEEGRYLDPFQDRDDRALVNDCRFHAQNAYALVMRTLARFELALGRRVSWQFGSHQLKVVPHALMDANAFYSRADEALLFGSFPALEGDETVHTCLSHDVVVHETTHALLDGLRQRFVDPSSPDQAAFHEGFADVVALLSVFSLEDVVRTLLDRISNDAAPHGQIPARVMNPDVLKRSALFGLAEQLGRNYPGRALSAGRSRALREVTLEPSTKYLQEGNEEFLPAHRRGEVLVAAMMNAFIRAWSDRLHREADPKKGEKGPEYLDRKRVVEDGADTADRLLTMAIRALDYTPPVHLLFSDYLSAIITADAEVRPDDSRFRFRKHLRESFAAYGIEWATGKEVPTLTSDQMKARTAAGQTVAREDAEETHAEDAAPRPDTTKLSAKRAAETQPSEPGAWAPASGLELSYERTHFEPMVREADEVFRFVWENRKPLKLYETAFTKVLSVRPCLRIAPDGFALKETVAEFYQVLRLRTDELRTLRIELPEGTLPDDTTIALYGGGTLIFDEFGRLRFYIHNSLDNPERQATRLEHLASRGFFRRRESEDARAHFAELHRERALDTDSDPSEEW